MLNKMCLNGFWNFAIGKNLNEIPKTFEKKKIHVPSPYNINSFAEGYSKQTAGEEYYVKGGDFRLYPEYPAEWEKADCGFYKRSFYIPKESNINRIYLCFDAVAYKSVFYLNGQKVYEDTEAFLPIEFEITKFVKFGEENELIVGAETARQNAYYDENGRKRTDYPEGSFWGGHIGGIWQDVWLIERTETFIHTIFARTDVYKQKLEIDYSYLGDKNLEDKAVEDNTLGDEIQEDKILRVEFVLSGKIYGIDNQEKVIYSGLCDGNSITWYYEKGEIELWDIDSPNLYKLKGRVYQEEKLLDETKIRFGFRTFQVEGNRFVLNGRPIHLKNDSWHYMGYSIQTPSYARSYYRMAKDANVNIIRLHAQPFPTFFYDIADEMGMLLVSESAVWASHCNFSYNQSFFENSKKHLERLIIRDRNHPSVVMWSPENECIPAYKVCGSKFIRDVKDLEDKLYELTKVISPLDTTRIISCDGSGDLGGRMEVTSLHYPGYHFQTNGEKPVTIGEMGSMYFSTPDRVCMDFGQKALVTMSGRLESVALDAFHKLTGQRSWAAQVCVFNLIWYGLKPLPFTERLIDYDDYEYEQPGIKPRRITRYLRTLNAGAEDGLPEYEPNEVFILTKQAFMPVRFFAEEVPENVYLKEYIQFPITVFYDAREDGILHLEVTEKGKLKDETLYEAVYEMKACTYVKDKVSFECQEKGGFKFELTLKKENEVVYQEERVLYVYDKEELRKEWKALNIALIKDGDEELSSELKSNGTTVPGLKAIDIRRTGEYSALIKEHDIKKIVGFHREYSLNNRSKGYYFNEYLNFNCRPLYFNGAGMPVAVSLCEGGVPRILCGLDLSKTEQEPLIYKLLIEMGSYLKTAEIIEPKTAYFYGKSGSRLSAMLNEVHCSYEYITEDELKLLLNEKQDRTLLIDGSQKLDWLKYIGGHNFETVVVLQAEKTPNLFSHLFEITEKKAYHLLPKYDKPMFNSMAEKLGLYGNNLYGLSAGKEEVMAEKLIQYRKPADQNIILSIPDIDWRMWNNNAEYLKTVSILKSEQTDNGRYSALSVHEYCNSKIYFSQMSYQVQSRRSKNCLVRLLSMTKVKLDMVKNDDLNELLFTGIYTNKLNAVLYQTVSEEEEISSLMPGLNLTDNGKVWTVKKEGDEIRSGVLAVYIYSPQDRTDLLLNPDQVDMEINAEKEVSIYLNGEYKQTGSRFTVTSIPLYAGFNTLIIHCKESWQIPEVSFIRNNSQPLDLKFSLYNGDIKKYNLKNAVFSSNHTPEHTEDASGDISGGYWITKTDQHYGIDFTIELNEATDIKAIYFNCMTSDIEGGCLTPYRFKIYAGNDKDSLYEVYESLREERMYYPEGRVFIRLNTVTAKYFKILLTENALKPFIIKDLALLV